MAEGLHFSALFIITVLGLCVCVFALICRFTHLNHKREVPTDSSQYRNDKKGDLAKNASFRSYAVISFTSAYTQYKYAYNTLCGRLPVAGEC